MNNKQPWGHSGLFVQVHQVNPEKTEQILKQDSKESKCNPANVILVRDSPPSEKVIFMEKKYM